MAKERTLLLKNVAQPEAGTARPYRREKQKWELPPRPSPCPSLSSLYSGRVLLLRLPIPIGPDTDRLVRSTEYQGGSLTGSPSSRAIQMAPSSLLTKEQGTRS